MDASQGVGFCGPPGHRNSMCQSLEDSSERICIIIIALYKNKDPFHKKVPDSLCILGNRVERVAVDLEGHGLICF